MSYLNVPRLHFAGRFQASVTTGNNARAHYDNEHFLPRYQHRQDPPNLNGGWNPDGDGAWRLAGCRVTGAVDQDGQPVRGEDPVLGYLVADAGDRGPARMVDLDPDQQSTPEIWALRLRLTTPDGTTVMEGRVATCALMDSWQRCPAAPFDAAVGGAYQSVVDEIDWADVSSSPFLRALRETMGTGELSMKLNLDGYQEDWNADSFTTGRVVGTLGVKLSAQEPRHFVAGRHLLAAGLNAPGPFSPAKGVNFCVAVVDRALAKVHLDLGNAIPTVSMGADLRDLGTLTLQRDGVAADGTPARAQIGTIDYGVAGFYERTAGVVTLPADRSLTEGELNAVAQQPLILTAGDSTVVMEAADGRHCRSDELVLRLEPHEAATVRVLATQFGEPAPEQRLIAFLDQTQLGTSDTPARDVLQFDARHMTDESGWVTVRLTATDPGKPRGGVDGTVVGVRVMLESALPPFPTRLSNPADYITARVWSDVTTDGPPTWHRDVGPILQQYANLYPVMARILDLGDYDAVCRHIDLMLLALGARMEDPNHMPVSRDLSPVRRRLIQTWLTSSGPDGRPLKGDRPAMMVAPPSSAVAPQELGGDGRGAKTEAAMRRREFRR